MRILLFVVPLCFALFVKAQSTDKIKIYFSQGVENWISPYGDGVGNVNFEDTIVKYISSANSTIDICNYNTSNLPIVQAINAAHTNGIQVRYIAADNDILNNNELNNLSAAVPLLQKPSDGNVMHNKFIIIDEADVNNSYVITGSMNHSNSSLHDDYNNMVIIQDKPLAEAYATEFEEMWGSSGASPNAGNAKFGPDKTDNTPHNFIIDGIAVELYFSPSDGTTAKIENALSTANADLSFGLLSFTRNDLRDEIILRENAGVDCNGIIENTILFGSEHNTLANAGVGVLTHLTLPETFHHKYCVVDATDTSSNPLVITGSHNWTNSAEDDNDENTLIIHDAEIAAMYYEEFLTNFQNVLGRYEVNDDLKELGYIAHQKIWVNDEGSYEIYAVDGTLTDCFTTTQSMSGYSLKNLKSGLYFLRSDRKTMKFVWVNE
ncbi:MAG: phospholipase D-like domain-containing protein [Flavobacteriales bacterium]|nr:phospholipase D-like domain-containing protein [Flavobacteriales bacterium]